MSVLLGKDFGEDVVKLYELILNKSLKKKYDWFDHIVVHRLSYSKSTNYMGLDCVIYADEDWVGEQWRKFYYAKPIPLPSGDEEEPIMLSEIISDDFSGELQNEFKLIFNFVTEIRKPKYISWSWTVVKPVEIVKKNLKEIITKVLREEIYSPASEEYIPGKFVAHKSNPVWRDNILETGLQISVGECYQMHVGGDIECKEAIFATDSLEENDMFDSTYDDDIWVINTECAGVQWYTDKHFNFDVFPHIVTFENISPDCLKLIHKGTGKSW